jgi:hypothetical protein
MHMTITRAEVDTRLLWILSGLFIAFTVIGTITHECGHALVARHYGYRPHIGYAYTNYDVSQEARLDSLWARYGTEITSRLYFPDSTFFWNAERGMASKNIRITWGGPVQTMLTGTVGVLLLLILWRRYRRAERLSGGLWLIVFSALFWLRQTTNFMLAMAGWLFTGHLSNSADEVQLARAYGLPGYSISGFTGASGINILGVVYCAIPEKQRLTFLLGGLTGGTIGYVLWLQLLGPIIMP